MPSDDTSSPDSTPDTVEQTQYDTAVKSIQHCHTIPARKLHACVCDCMLTLERGGVKEAKFLYPMNSTKHSTISVERHMFLVQLSIWFCNFPATLHSKTNSSTVITLQALTCLRCFPPSLQAVRLPASSEILVREQQSYCYNFSAVSFFLQFYSNTGNRTKQRNNTTVKAYSRGLTQMKYLQTRMCVYVERVHCDYFPWQVGTRVMEN